MLYIVFIGCIIVFITCEIHFMCIHDKWYYYFCSLNLIVDDKIQGLRWFATYRTILSMLHSNLFLSIDCFWVFVAIIYDKTTMADHHDWVLPLHCQYRDDFVTSIMYIENKSIVEALFWMHIIDVTMPSLCWKCNGGIK